MKSTGLNRRLLTAVAATLFVLVYNLLLPGEKAGGESYAAYPKARSFSLQTWARVFHNNGFVVGYSEYRHDPIWVSYQATAIERQHHFQRPEGFEIDQRTWSRVSSSDYSNSGYQRGHMAPNYIISEDYGRRAQRETFLMSNITPQRPNLNEKVWQRLEEAEADDFTHWFDGLWVTTGPVFDDHPDHLGGGVDIPHAFYRLFVGVDSNGTPHMIAFLVPQDVHGNEPLNEFVTTVDDIEARTGLDFFSDLPDTQEEKLESSPADGEWRRLPEVSRRRSRY